MVESVQLVDVGTSFDKDYMVYVHQQRAHPGMIPQRPKGAHRIALSNRLPKTAIHWQCPCCDLGLPFVSEKSRRAITRPHLLTHGLTPLEARYLQQTKKIPPYDQAVRDRHAATCRTNATKHLFDQAIEYGHQPWDASEFGALTTDKKDDPKNWRRLHFRCSRCWDTLIDDSGPTWRKNPGCTGGPGPHLQYRRLQWWSIFLAADKERARKFCLALGTDTTTFDHYVRHGSAPTVTTTNMI